jgi:hypothetical protein
LRAHGGKTAEQNRCRSPVSASMRRSLTRGARTATAPAPAPAPALASIPRLVVTVTHHQPVAVLVAFAGELGDVGVHPGPQRLGQHPPRALAHDLVDQRPTQRAGPVVGASAVFNYLEHGRTFPNRRANGAAC